MNEKEAGIGQYLKILDFLRLPCTKKSTSRYMKKIFFKKMDNPQPLYLIIFVLSIQSLTVKLFNINFAYDWIWTADFQLSHIHF